MGVEALGGAGPGSGEGESGGGELGGAAEGVGDGLGDGEGDGDGLGDGEGDGVGDAEGVGADVDAGLPGSGEEDPCAAGVCDAAAPPVVGRASMDTCAESIVLGPVAQPASAATASSPTTHRAGSMPGWRERPAYNLVAAVAQSGKLPADAV